MDTAAVLAAFDDQLRRNVTGERAAQVERDERVTRVMADGDGWSGVVWSDLADGDVEAVIASEIQTFAARARRWEWKLYDHDRPADLPERLRAAGFVPDPVEAVLVADLADLVVSAEPPDGVELVPVVDRETADNLVAVHDGVFGGSHEAIGRRVLAGLGSAPPSIAAAVAVTSSGPIAAGRVEFPPRSDFATLWGGGTVPAWRGRGVFRSLVAHRAALARARGYRYLQVDASSASRPVLRRLGFVQLATTTPWRWTDGSSS